MHFHHCIARFSRRMPSLRSFSRIGSAVSDTFYSGKTYGEVIGNKELGELLAKSNFAQLSLSQALAYPPLSRGQSVVLAAETGSGKTLAYLVPLIEGVLRGRAAAAATAAEGVDVEVGDSGGIGAADELFDD